MSTGEARHFPWRAPPVAAALVILLAVILHSCATRYEAAGSNIPASIDRWTGEVCVFARGCQ